MFIIRGKSWLPFLTITILYNSSLPSQYFSVTVSNHYLSFSLAKVMFKTGKDTHTCKNCVQAI